MKVCILSFEESLNTKTLRGVSTTTKYLQQNLKNLGLDVDLAIYGKTKFGYPEDFCVAHYCSDYYDLSELGKSYDFIIYFTPGRSWEKFNPSDPNKYLDVIEAIGLPFTTIYHSEEYATHQPYRLNFIRSPYCKFITFIEEGFVDLYQNDLAICPSYVSVSMVPPLKSLDEILNYKKTDSIIITSAWTNFKRNLEYFKLVGRFRELGLTPYSAGAPNSNFYMNDILDELVESITLLSDDSETTDFARAKYSDYAMMMSRIKQEVPYKRNSPEIPNVYGALIHTFDGDYWYDYGAYFPDQIEDILREKMYHWNMSCYKVNKVYVPRLEIVTLEALNCGCLPILCKETTPDWISEDSAIRLSKKDYEDHIDILGNISETERYERIIRFYNLVKKNLYEGMFESLANKIMEVL